MGSNNDTNFCRICLSDQEDLLPLFENNSLGKKLLACASVEVEEGDTLPSTVCLTCIIKLNEAYDFRELIRRSDTLLRSKSYIKKNYYIDKYYSSESFDPSTTEAEKDRFEKIQLFEECTTLKYSSTQSVCTTPKNSPVISRVSSEGKNSVAYQPKKSISTQKLRKKFKNNRISADNRRNQKLLINQIKCCRCYNLCEEPSSVIDVESTAAQVIHKAEEHFSWRTNNKKIRKHVCNTCGKSFRNALNAKEHAETHGIMRPYKCNVCNCDFKTSKNLNDHIIIHYGDGSKRAEKKPRKCLFCERQFFSNTRFNQHMKNHIGELQVLDKPHHSYNTPKVSH